MSQNKTYIIIGASGFIGRYLTLELANRGHVILALTRNKKRIKKVNGIKWIEGDIEDRNIWEKLLIKDAIVIHLAYSENINRDHYHESLRWMARQSKIIGVKKIIYCSTATVVGRVKENKVTEATTCNPINKYDKEKLDAENILISNISDTELIILRPAVVFGIGGQNLQLMVNRIMHAGSTANYIIRSIYGDRKLNLLYVENLISVIIYFIDTGKDYSSEIFIVSEDEEKINNYADVEKIIRDNITGQETTLYKVKLPVIVLKLLLYLRGRGYSNPNRIFSNEKLFKLGVSKRYSLEQAVCKYALDCRKEVKV